VIVLADVARVAVLFLVNDAHGAVVVVVVAVRMFQTSVDEVIHVVAVRNLLVPAVRAVNVRRALDWIAAVGVDVADWNHVLVDVILVRVVQVAVVQVVDVAEVLDGRVTATRTVNVVVVGMFLALPRVRNVPAHRKLSFKLSGMAKQ
jgi:hypothetical protein